jgi:hypothetical protein
MSPRREIVNTYPRKERPYLAIQAAVSAALAKEGIRVPPIQFDIALLRHDTPQDAYPILHRMDAAEIIIPELNGLTPEQLRLLRLVPEGTLTASQFIKQASLVDPEMKSPFHKTLLKTNIYSWFFMKQDFMYPIIERLYRSKKYIGHIDTKKADLTKTLIPEKQRLGKALKRDYTYSQAIKAAIDCETQTATYMRERDDVMISNLVPTIVEAIRSRPDLQYPRTKPITVFMYLGWLHFPIAQALQNSDTKVSYTVAESEPLTEQTKLTAYAYSGNNIPERLAARSMLETIFDILVANSHNADYTVFLGSAKQKGALKAIGALVDVFEDKAGELYEYLKLVLRENDAKRRQKMIEATLGACIKERRALLETRLKRA